jgi:small subunit ribosomal protein S16
MLSIRLSRRGKKKQPTYRIIILEKTKDPWGDFLEDLGFYNPHTKQAGFKKERIQYWLSHGAQASPTVHNLLVTHKVIEGTKVKATKKKKKKAKVEAPLSEAGPPASPSESEAEPPAEEKPAEKKEKKSDAKSDSDKDVGEKEAKKPSPS